MIESMIKWTLAIAIVVQILFVNKNIMELFKTFNKYKSYREHVLREVAAYRLIVTTSLSTILFAVLWLILK